MMMQELPMEQMNLATGAGGGPDQHQTHLDRLENLKEEVGVDVKPGWDSDIKPPWDRKLLSPHSPPPHHRQWIRPEDYEDEQRAKSVLENGGQRPEYCENMPSEDDHYPNGPFSGPNESPFHDGPPTPHGVHSFSPENMLHNGMDGPPGSNSVSKKSSSRRNAWGNLSYADLITQAILSSPEKRLTLSQVYDWMVQNIPYFKDKGDSNSSAGWKNSIRHNLSLHSKFIRVQNEGTGKSSWWMVNPDATKTGKSSRRRASNPDNGKGFDNRRRGRSKKSMDAFGNGQESTPSPNGIVEGFPDSPLPPGFPFPHDMRIRAGSNGTEFGPGGRISPLRHEYFQEGGWPPQPGHPGQEYHGNMVAYGPPHGFRPEFCEGNPEMMERIGMDPRMSPHPGMPPHLRPNGFPYPRPPFHHDPSYPHSPLMGHPNGEHFQGVSHVSPAHGPSLSPVPGGPGYPSPDHAPTPVSAHESLMSPHQMSHNRQFFPGGPGGPPAPAGQGGQANSCALSTSSGAAPDSPAPGSSSSSGSMLERALTAKQEPGEEGPLPLESGEHPPPPHHHPGHPPHLHPHPHQPDWPHIASDFGDVNVQEYIKHDYGMDNIEFSGYPGHHGPGPDGDHHGQYPHQPHPAQVSVAPPWVR